MKNTVKRSDRINHLNNTIPTIRKPALFRGRCRSGHANFDRLELSVYHTGVYNNTCRRAGNNDIQMTIEGDIDDFS